MSIQSDAVLLAEAIFDEWKAYDNCDYSPMHYYCLFCYNNSHKSHDDVKHNLNCPVLVAKDILTIRNSTSSLKINQEKLFII